MKRLFLLCVVAMCVVFSFRVQGQETISIGERHTLFSRLLNEERAYWVYQPEKRPGETERNYPVLYLLDGDSFFHTVVGFTRFFSSSRVSSLPPCVVVAVLNTDRTRDLTPTPSAARRDGTVRSGDEPKGGGAEQFYRFLVEELRPAIEKEFPVGGQNMLVGHSFAGLFALHVLWNHPESFDTYMALDPSLWWDQGAFLKQAGTRGDKTVFDGKQLYVAFATRPRTERNLIHFPLTDTFLDTVIPEMERCNLRVVSKKFPEETHGTIALPAIYDGLKCLFAR